jgi:hypothetical protein
VADAELAAAVEDKSQRAYAQWLHELPIDQRAAFDDHLSLVKAHRWRKADEADIWQAQLLCKLATD